MVVASHAYNPNQPRHPAGKREGGRWKDMAKEAQAGRRKIQRRLQEGDPRVPQSGEILPWVEEELGRDGDEIRSQTFETSIIYNADGEVIAQGDGDEDSAELRVPWHATITAYAQLHNHPDGSSFSPQDLDNVFLFPVAEMRVVTRDRTVTMRPGSSGWGSRTAYRRLVDDAYPRLVRTARLAETLGEDRWWAVSDGMWREVAPKLGWRYTVEDA